MPFFGKGGVGEGFVAEEGFVEDEVVADGGRRSVPFLGKGGVVGAGYVVRGLTLGVSPGNEGGQHSRGHEDIEGQQREYVAQELDLEKLEEHEGGDGPSQQQQVGALAESAAPRQPRRYRSGQPGGDAQGQSQAPD